ncbi:rhodanese family protein [Enterobacter oligotrophicus]|mgnify:CR=1 FL=1|uniref:rhodanese family protein n=1 Tax=Enterobacter TaxID=547 RepID=UPI001C01587A|nr:rhodanese family protein [Enterobacter oligotrophicus]ELW1645935.1 rhodanese family protein [Enterobacter oligotrophicus]MBT9426565.1 rhodanese family protein [Enterobacter oligotrophicus]
MTSESVSPQEAQRLIEQGAVLIDIRDRAEYLREHIPYALSLPLADITADKTVVSAERQPVIFHCLTGMRTAQNAHVLTKAASPAPVLLMAGGINAWKSAGLPTIEDKKQPLPVMRQVQIVAGTLILTGVVLGYAIDSRLFLLSGFVGAGLLFAGLSGLCGMASLLLKMPWNRPAK